MGLSNSDFLWNFAEQGNKRWLLTSKDLGSLKKSFVI